MSIVAERDLYATAIMYRNMATVIFGSKPYRRVGTKVWVNSHSSGGVKLYRGDPQAQAVIDSNQLSSPATFTAPFDLAAGQALYVVFDVAPSPVGLAEARFSAMRSED